jgi:Holliday junction resolvase RusA-like endonuclease
MILYLSIPVPPAPRPRVTRRGISFYPKVYRDFKTNAKKALAAQWEDEPLCKPLSLEILVLQKKPKSRIRKATANQRLPRANTRGDLDNLLKSILDVMEDAQIFTNDNIIYSIKIEGWFAAENEEPLTTIKLHI